MLESKTFILRPLQSPQDVSLRYLSWVRDPEINRTLQVDGSSQTLQTLSEYVDKHDRVTCFLFGIFSKDGLHIGTHSFRFFPEDERAVVGTMIGDREYWGKGVPLETRACILNWAFSEFVCEKVEAGCFSNNIPAIFNFVKEGWVREGIQRHHRLMDGTWVDAINYGLLRDEWIDR